MWHFCDKEFANIKSTKECFNMREELLKGLTEEQIARVKNCKNSDELLALAKAEGIELTDEQLTAISGGGVCSVVSNIGDAINQSDCPMCGCNDVTVKDNWARCKGCGFEWNRL
jgi:hypothetical protein